MVNQEGQDAAERQHLMYSPTFGSSERSARDQREISEISERKVDLGCVQPCGCWLLAAAMRGGWHQMIDRGGLQQQKGCPTRPYRQGRLCAFGCTRNVPLSALIRSKGASADSGLMS